MQRRRFLGSTLSVLSLTMMNPEFTQAIKLKQSRKLNQNSDKNVLERFVKVFDCKSCDKCWSDLSFVRLYEQTAVDLLRNDYCLSDKHTYLFAASDLVMVALELKVASVGSVNRYFLFYGQLPDSQWKYLKSFNAYEADAIACTADAFAMQFSNKETIEFLLPCYAKQRMPVSYFTQKGHVDMKIVLNAVGVRADIHVWDRQESLFHQAYNLSYGLKLAV